jgi:periplasmic divalent cation tolerance protein
VSSGTGAQGSTGTEVVRVTFTVDDRAVAERLVEELVAGGSVACGQVSGPIASTYRWRGAVERAEEWRADLTTTRRRAPSVVASIRSGHPYETPEVLVTPVLGGDPDYLAWIVDEASG